MTTTQIIEQEKIRQYLERLNHRTRTRMLRDKLKKLWRDAK